jgi:TRAP transporter 4TM/12TM fusion protein
MSVGSVSLSLRTLMLLIGAAFILDVPSDLFGMALWQEQIGLVMTGLVSADIFILYTRQGKNRRESALAPDWPDRLLALLSLLIFGYAAFHFEELVALGYLDNPEGLFISVAVTALVCETTRRTCGWSLVIVLLGFMVYGLTANLFSGLLQGREVGLYELFTYSVLDPSGLLGSSLSVVTSTVLAFVIFGATLFGLGGGKLFLDLALSGMRGIRGGAGKGAIVASTLFGTISGSAVSNVVTIGIVTIPLMNRSGFSKKDSAAIEAVASTGGQIMPPIMGSAAFIMADTLSIPYASVAKAALLPALLYYLTLFLQVHFRAARLNILPLDEAELPQAASTLRQYWPFLIPVMVLVYLLFSTAIAPHKIALLATAICVVAALFTPSRPTWNSLREIVEATGSGMLSIIPAVAVAGIIIAILSITGLGFTFGLGVVDEAGGNLYLLLILTALAALVLGLGLPTTAVYIVMAGLVAPALTTAGVPDLAAHLFVFYFGVLSMITPPVCLAAMAAASIAGSDFMQTGNAAMKLSFTGFFVPFLFALCPELLSLDLGNPHYWLQVGLVTGGFTLLAAAVEGYLHKPLNLQQRYLLTALSLVMFGGLLI